MRRSAEQMPKHPVHQLHTGSNTGLFISPSGISELDCATTKTDTAERSISTETEILQFWRDSLLIDMLLSAVSVLVVAQSSSEIP